MYLYPVTPIFLFPLLCLCYRGIVVDPLQCSVGQWQVAGQTRLVIWTCSLILSPLCFYYREWEVAGLTILRYMYFYHVRSYVPILLLCYVTVVDHCSVTLVSGRLLVWPDRWSEHVPLFCHSYIPIFTPMCVLQGDSGGPLQCNVGQWEVAGLTSWGDSMCDTRKPSVYARTSYFRNWIRQQTGV